MLIAKYKFDSSLYDLIPEFNSGYTGYTYTDEVSTNIFNGEWTNGSINPGTGVDNEVASGATAVRSDYMQIEPNMSYVASENLNIFWYDTSKNFINTNGDVNITISSGTFFKAPSNASYLRVYRGSQINLEIISAIKTRTIECDTLPTMMRFGDPSWQNEITPRVLSLLEVLEINATNLTTCNRMFGHCQNLTSCNIMVSNKTTSLCQMFHDCHSLINLNTNGWDTSNVTDLQGTFQNCTKITELNINAWNTGEVRSISNIFQNCRGLTSLDISDWDVGQATSMNNIFYNCNNLTTLDVSKWDTSKVTNMSYMFYQCRNLTSLDLSKWDTSKVTNMADMFYDCQALTTIGDLTNWNTKLVESIGSTSGSNTYSIFKNCSSLTSLTFGENCTFEKVTNMQHMFYGCSSLTEINGLEHFNTSSCTNMNNMFRDCSNLTSLDTSSFNTSKVTSMASMFRDCSNLTSLNVSGFNTSNVTQMGSIFNGCSRLTDLDVSNFNTSNVTNMSSMFQSCSSLTSLNLSVFNTSNVTNMNGMFGGCSSLTTLDVSNFDAAKVTTMQDVFYNCNTLKYLKCNNVNTLNTLNTYLPTKSSNTQGTIICKSDITNLDTTTLQSKYWTVDTSDGTMIAKYKFDKSICNSLVPEFNSGFGGYFCNDVIGGSIVTREIVGYGGLPTMMRFGRLYVDGESITNNRTDSLLEVLDMTTVGLTDCNNMFRYCKNLTSITCEWDTSNASSMYGMFDLCYSLTTLDVSNFDTSNVTSLQSMFYNCYELTTLDVSNFDTSNVTNMWSIFFGCKNLTTLDVSNWNTSKVTNMYGVFYNCYELTTLDVSNWNTSKVTYMNNMFYACTKLSSLDISNFDTSKVTNASGMFNNTPLLTDIGVLYMDKSSLQKLVNAMPTDSNKTLWYKDVNIDGITHGNNITLKKYIEENVEIVLNSPLLEGDTIEVHNGKLCHYHKMGMVVLDGSEDWQDRWNSGYGIEKHHIFHIKIQGKKREQGISDMFANGTLLSLSGECVLFREGGEDEFGINIKTSRLSSSNINGFKQWLQANPTTVVYELDTPYYEEITPLQSSIALRTFEECNIQIITALPIKTKITYRTNITSAIVMEQDLDTLDSGVSLSNLIEEEVNE